MKAHDRLKFWLCTTFLLGVGGFLAFSGWSHLALHRALDREGGVTTGRIVAHSSESYSRRSSNLKLTVAFTPANHPPVTKTLSVDGATYSTAVKLGEVKVRYLPDQPERCLAGDVALLPYQVILALGGVLVLAAVLLLGRYGRSSWTPLP
jgi:hypothetical protein